MEGRYIHRTLRDLHFTDVVIVTISHTKCLVVSLSSKNQMSIAVLLHDLLTLAVICLVIAIGFKLCKQFRVGIRLDEAS